MLLWINAGEKLYLSPLMENEVPILKLLASYPGERSWISASNITVTFMEYIR